MLSKKTGLAFGLAPSQALAFFISEDCRVNSETMPRRARSSRSNSTTRG